MCDLSLRTLANDKRISRKHFRQRKQCTKATEGKNSLTFLNNCKEIRIAKKKKLYKGDIDGDESENVDRS